MSAALDLVEGADHAAQFLISVTCKRPGAWWREDFTLRFATINGLPGLIVDAPEGPVHKRPADGIVCSFRCRICLRALLT